MPDLQHRYLGSRRFIMTALNARSLHANIGNIQADQNILQSNLIFVQETWANETDPDNHYTIPGFTMSRKDNTMLAFEQRPHRGIIAYHRECTFTITHTEKHSSCDIMCTTVTTPLLALNVVAVYRSPQLAMKDFLLLMASGMQTLPPANPCIILADFNVDIKGMSPDTALKLALQDADHHLKCLVQFMMEHKLSQMVTAPTVDSGMQIDHLWTDVPSRLNHMDSEAFVLETFYSDYRPIGLQVRAPAEA